MNQLEKDKLKATAKYIRESLLNLTDLIQTYELPYELELKFDMKHKNWNTISDVHSR